MCRFNQEIKVDAGSDIGFFTFSYLSSNVSDQSNDCTITEIIGNGDNYFELDEKVTISENGVDLCSSGPCSQSVVAMYIDSIKMYEGEPCTRDGIYSVN